MAFEVADGGGATTAVDVPTLSEIENDEMEKVMNRLEEFQNYSQEEISKYKDEIEKGSGRKSFRRLQGTVNEIGRAMAGARKAKKTNLEEQLIHLQGQLGYEFTQDFPSDIVIPPNPFISPIGLHEYGANVMNDNSLEEGDRERLIQAIIKEAENNNLEISKPLDINKETYRTLGTQITHPEVQAVYNERIKMADRVTVIKKDAEEEDGGEFFLWKGIKWVGKKLLGFAGSILGRAAFYTAIGGAGAYLIHKFIPGAPSFFKKIFSTIAPKFTDAVINIGTKIGGVISKGYNAVKGFFSSIFG